MSQTVDNRVVEMEFDNAEFERGISTSIASLERLKESLNFEGAVKGFDALANFETSGKEGFENLKKGVERVKASFSGMQIVGYTAIQELTKGVMGLGGRFLSFLAGPLAQIEAGGKKRAQNIEQARFQMQGLGLDVEEAMRNSLDAVDGTAYGLDAAAKAAGQFAASGVKLGKDMTTSLRGVAGVAAMTNSSFEDISNIFTTVASNGKLMTMQLRQFSARGLNATAVLAKALGKTEAQIAEMTTKGEISFEQFSTAMSDAFGDQATKANDTYAGSLMNVQAALSRIGAKFYAPYYENMRQTLNELRLVINAISSGLDPLFAFTERIMILSRTLAISRLQSLDFSGMSEGLMRVLIPTIDVLVNITSGLSGIFKAVGAAWRNVFPPMSITPVVNLLEYIAQLTSNFGLSEKNLGRLTKTMEGFFSIIKVAAGGIGLLLKGLGSLLGFLGEFVGPILTPLLAVVGAIGSFISGFVKAIEYGRPPMEAFSIQFDLLAIRLSAASKTFSGAGKVVTSAIGGIATAVSFVAKVLKNVDLDFRPLTVFAGEVDSSLSPFTNQNGNVFDRAAEGVRTGLTNFKNAFEVVDSKFYGFIQGIGEGFAKAFESLGKAVDAVKPVLEAGGKVISYFFNLIKNAFEGVNAIDLINAGFFAALVLVIKRVLTPIADLGEAVTGLLDAAREALESWQKKLQPSLLVAIGAAVLMLAGAFLIMAQVPKEKLVGTLAAVSVLLAELTGAMLLLSYKVGDKSITKLAVAMTILSTAVLILAKSVEVLGGLDLKEAAIGIAGVSVLIWELVAISVVLKKAEADMIKGSTSLLFFSSSLYIMAYAVKNLGSMDIETLKTGLLSIAGLIAMLGLFMKSTEKSMAQMPAFAAGLLLMAAALNLLVLPLLLLGKIPWQILAQGLTVVTATLAIVAFAANAMQSVAAQMTKLGAGLLLLAVALNLLIAPLLILSVIPIEVLGQGLFVLSGLLAVLATMAIVLGGPMEGQIVKVAAALMLLAVAVNLLMIPILVLGALPFDVMINGLTALAGLFLVLGVAALAFSNPLMTAGLLSMAGGLALVGLAANLAGVGLLLIAAGLSALAVSLTGVATVLPLLLTALESLFNQMVESVQVVIISIVNSLGAILTAIVKALIQVIIDASPKLFELLGILMQGIIDLIATYGPKLIELAMNLVMAFIQGIEDRTEDLVESALGIIENLLKGIADGIPGVAEAGADVIIAFLDAVASQNLRIVQAAFDIAISFIQGLTDTLTTRGPELSDAMSELAGAMLQTFVDVIFAPAKGVFSTGQNIVTGVIDGIKDKFAALKEAAANAGSWLLDALNGKLEVSSPSKATYRTGGYSADGLIAGVLDKKDKIKEAGYLSGSALYEAYDESLDKIAPKSEKTGEDAGKSLGTGISSGSKHSTEAAKKAAEEALKAIHETFATISVSEGKYLVDGIVIGMVSKEPNMFEASKFLAIAVQKGLIEEASQFKEIGDTEASAFLKGLSDEEIITKAWAAGVKVSSSAWEGAKDTAEAMEAAGAAAGQAYIDGLNKAAKEAAAKADAIAKMASSGGYSDAFARQVAKEKSGVNYTLDQLSKLTDSEAKKYYEAGGGAAGKAAVEAGKNASSGLANGITSGVKAVKDAITNVTKAAVDTAKKNLDINSPSGVFEDMGEFSGLGFVNGLRAMAYKISNESKNLGKSAIDGINSAISNIVDIVNSDIEYAPVIRPVLDLDSVQNGMKNISDILNQENVLATKIANDKNPRGINSENQDITSDKKQGNTYEFKQYNYSPKPLSRIDIYRQTKNQFSTLKGLVTDND